MSFRPLLSITALLGGLAACAEQAPNDPAVPPEAPIAKEATPKIAPIPDEVPSKWATLAPTWVALYDPFRVIGNIHYVGSAGLSSFLITSEEGHILLDGTLPENATMIAENISALGFKIEDVKILLNTHAHFDHSGGLAELKKMSGAKMVASEGDRSSLEGGFYLGSEENEDLNAPPVAVDQIIADGETITLGAITMTARVTPGHTRGCTSWQLSVVEEGETYEALIFCSASVALNRLVTPLQYEGIVEDYRTTFDITKDWRPDVFLSNHPQFFYLDDKRQKQEAGDPLAFVNAEEFPAFIARTAQDFEENYEKQKARADAE